MKIQKYRLPDKACSIDMPKNAEILKVGFHGKTICIWATIKEENTVVTRHFRLLGAGYEFYIESYRHLETVIENNGENVWHVFEIL